MIKAVFIDIDDTILDFKLSAGNAIAEAFKERSMEMPNGAVDTFIAVGKILWRRLENKEITFEELQQQRFNMIFERLGIDCDGVEFERNFRKNLAHSAVKMENAEELLAYLSQKYKIFATSNSPHRQQEIRLEKAGLLKYISEILTSERVGYSKPDRRFFEECFKFVPEARPEEIMMIGDTFNADIRGGAESGLKTCWLNVKGQAAEAGTTPDHTVYSLLEIKEIL